MCSNNCGGKRLVVVVARPVRAAIAATSLPLLLREVLGVLGDEFLLVGGNFIG